MAEISVIVTVYNREELLPRCVESILSQTFDDIEVVLVDDGSTDSSGALCDAYAEKDSRVIAVHTENRGVGGAKNTGVRESTGNYIGFADSDDYILPDMYEKLYDAIVRDKTDAAKCGIHYVAAGSGYPPPPDLTFPGHPVTTKQLLSDNLHCINVCTVVNMLIKARYVMQSRFWDGRASEVKFFLDISGQIDRLSTITDVCYHVVLHDGQISANVLNNPRYCLDLALIFADYFRVAEELGLSPEDKANIFTKCFQFTSIAINGCDRTDIKNLKDLLTVTEFLRKFKAV